MDLFRDSAEFGPTLDITAERLGISATAVEKDYWVSEVLRHMAANYQGAFIFKGGTSLSKGYRIIERFSEDIDVLIIPGERGRGATDTLMRSMAASVAAGINGESRAVGGAETGRHRTFEIRYPATREPTSLIQSSVRLEMGVRGGPFPHETLSIGSLLGDALAGAGTDLGSFVDLTPSDVEVLHPGRALLEKLVLIHDLARQLVADPSTPIPDRNGRHFYDVYQLLGDDRVLALLGDRDQVQMVMDSVVEITRRYFDGATADVLPVDGFATSPAFDPTCEVSAALRSGYEATMPELYFGSASLPSWEEICVRVRSETALP